MQSKASPHDRLRQTGEGGKQSDKAAVRDEDETEPDAKAVEALSKETQTFFEEAPEATARTIGTFDEWLGNALSDSLSAQGDEPDV
ncbi:MAG: hypothetical protein IT322_13940, partial [Anaerolineae bacterium]|nr:hypothetical protein [Anaerolineae bacterium]